MGLLHRDEQERGTDWAALGWPGSPGVSVGQDELEELYRASGPALNGWLTRNLPLSDSHPTLRRARRPYRTVDQPTDHFVSHLVGWPEECRPHGCFPFGVPQACDEIACDADRYVEELVCRCTTPPGLASSSSRYALLSRRRPASSASAAISTTTAIRIPSR
jgi:hypothetical protein